MVLYVLINLNFNGRHTHSTDLTLQIIRAVRAYLKGSTVPRVGLNEVVRPIFDTLQKTAGNLLVVFPEYENHVYCNTSHHI